MVQHSCVTRRERKWSLQAAAHTCRSHAVPCLPLLLVACRTEYMTRVLAHLHGQGVSVSHMQQVMQQLPYTHGMEQLLQELQGGSIGWHSCTCIILSDRCVRIAWQPTVSMHRAGRLHCTQHLNTAQTTQQAVGNQMEPPCLSPNSQALSRLTQVLPCICAMIPARSCCLGLRSDCIFIV
jgi:hypothetical protein